MINVAILLSAGKSSRMGELKALLKWGDSTLIEKQVRHIVASGVSQIVIVTGYGRERLSPYLEKLQEVYGDQLKFSIVHNDYFEDGKTSSIRLGISSIYDPRNVHGIAIIGVDQPVRLETLNYLYKKLNVGDILVPSYRGKKGHPPVFSSLYMHSLSQINEEQQGLRQVIRAYSARVRVIDVLEPQVLLNLNHVKDYEEARQKQLDQYDDLT